MAPSPTERGGLMVAVGQPGAGLGVLAGLVTGNLKAAAASMAVFITPEFMGKLMTGKHTSRWLISQEKLGPANRGGIKAFTGLLAALERDKIEFEFADLGTFNKKIPGTGAR